MAPVVHMQSVRGEERLERDSLPLVPMAHERKAMKHVDLLLRRGARDQIDHVFDLGLRNDLRRELRGDHNNVHAACRSELKKSRAYDASAQTLSELRRAPMNST